MPRPHPAAVRRLTAALCVALAISAAATMSAQIPGRNTNMVAGTELPDGDPFLQRQNEPSLGASTRNPLHLLAGSNDYRTVDLPGLPEGQETGDAWLGLYKSFDGGQRWASTLLPGYPQDTTEAGLASPLKGYQAAADPVIRAGTSGLLYYSGLVFDRAAGGRSAIFVSRFIDRNNKENGDPIVQLGTSLVAQSNGDAFLDKPWMAVDMPRGGFASWCLVGGSPQVLSGGKVKRNGHRRRRGPWRNEPPNDGGDYVAAGAVYVAYSSITGEGPTLRSEIYLRRSMDCGATWSAPIRVSGATDRINQGATLAISPTTGHLFVAYRRFATTEAPDADAIMVTRLPYGAFAPDPPGKARGLRRAGDASENEDRVSEHRRRRARPPSTAASVANFDQGTSTASFRTNAYPTMTFDGAGRAYVAWTERGFAAARFDPVDGDARVVVTTTTDARTFSPPVVADDRPPASQQELYGHQLMPSLTFAGGKLLLVYYDLRETRAQVFGKFASDAISTNGKRQTFDIRAALASPGATPQFAPSVRVSDYLVGYRSRTTGLEQLQVNPPNLPMFKQGTVPFVGDYIDVAPAPAFVPTAGGGWTYNMAPSDTFPLFHAAWTDNRDVRAPLFDTNGDGNPWNDYAPPGATGGTSVFDPTQATQVCTAGNAGSRNQNIYTARIGGGLLVGAPGNSKPLSPTIQRGFVVFAHNQTTVTRTFRMAVPVQPTGGRASFDQFPRPPYTTASPAPLTAIDVRVPGRSSASRTLYVTAPDPRAQVAVTVTEVSGVGGGAVTGGLTGTVVLNPDIENPDIENPDIENPDIENPDIENPDIENGTISDVTWTVSNIGNTTSAFNVNLFLANASVPAGFRTQLILYKTYKTPVAVGCALRIETRNVLITNVPSPVFVPPGTRLPNQNDPSEKNATLWLNPGELGRITLRVYDPDKADNVVYTNPDGTTASVDPRFDPATQVTPGVSAQGVDVLDPPGATKPPVVTATGTNVFFLQQPTTTQVNTAIAPPVRVRVWDNAGTPLAGVAVSIGFASPTPGAVLGGATTAVSDVDGIATFPGLTVNLAGTYVLRAQATASGVTASGVTVPFAVIDNAPAAVGTWTATGDGVVTLLDGGPATPSFRYAHDGDGVNGTPTGDGPYSGTWQFTAPVTSGSQVELRYAWQGFHSFFQATAGLQAFVRRATAEVFTVTLRAEGPQTCPPCTPPSAGFLYGGSVMLNVQPGDVVGFRLTGSHGDLAERLDGTFAVGVSVDPAPVLASLRPNPMAAGEGFVVLRGPNLPPPSTATAVISNGLVTANGFIFQSPSTTSAYWVRLPSGFPLGSATVRILGGPAPSTPLPITIAATPGTPFITGVFDAVLQPATSYRPGFQLHVAADGIDTSGAVVRFDDGTTVVDVVPDAGVSNGALGLAARVTVPATLTGATVQVSVRQGGGAFSAPVTLPRATF